MVNKEVGKIFFNEVWKIYIHENLSFIQKTQALSNILSKVFVELTEEEKLQFTTLFARITYACQKNNVPKKLQFYIHRLRKEIRNGGTPQTSSNTLLPFALRIVCDTIYTIYKVPIPDKLAAVLPDEGIYPDYQATIASFLPFQQVVVTGDLPEKELLTAVDADNPELEILIQYNIPERNENFKLTIDYLRKVFHFPITVNLIDVEIDNQGLYRPRALVLEPDYLVDVTAIAECFSSGKVLYQPYLINKFLPFSPGIPLIVGNMANLFLDELMAEPEQTFQEILKKAFSRYPLTFALLSDAEVRTIREKSQKHFLNIKQMVIKGFRDKEIEPEATYLEPSFYSEKYGLQGRLDIFFPNEGGKGAIIELKSGRPFMPNIYGLGASHYIQTLLYDLMITSIYGKDLSLINYILYSGQDDNILRYAPSVKANQMEALQARNMLLAIDRQLMKQLETNQLTESALFNRLNPKNHPDINGFLKGDLERFFQVYSRMSKIERSYFIAYSGFIAREHHLAKTGIQGDQQSNGQAGLWRNTFDEKEEQYDLLSHLVLLQNQARDSEPILRLKKSNATNPLANFRIGDIVVIYPYWPNTDQYKPSLKQIFKCTILTINEEEVVVRLRSRQFNLSSLEKVPYWNLEHDHLDSSFSGLYRQLFSFFEASADKKALLFSTKAPRQSQPFEGLLPGEALMTAEQQLIMRNMIGSQDYFLLWGPPGTGKTSVMLKFFVGYLFEHTKENLLLLAYTNRAVDEICEAIESYHEDMKENYIRIGSRYATGTPYLSNLLDKKLEHAQSRQEIIEEISKYRIFVGTVAAISGKPEIFHLKKFDRIIIDEASQILEPALIGLLTRFPKFVLIGDHRQLPAVVTQQELPLEFKETGFEIIGLKSLHDSLFERLIRRATQEDWTWAIGTLSHQGRMHKELMSFPNTYFYEGQLQTLPPETKAAKRQYEPLSYSLPSQADALDKILCTQRCLFIPSPVDQTSLGGKTNKHEADIIADLIQRLIRIVYHDTGQPEENSIGIITPYRAQIAQLIKVFNQRQLPVEKMTIDTVERYQGGARNIIILSLCLNQSQQLKTLVNLSNEGIDRKLNVALTRARNQLILVGNPEILKQNTVYANFIQQYQIKEKLTK